MRGWGFGGLVLMLAFRPLAVAAEPRIVWECPDECPASEASRAKVAELLRTPLSALDLQLTAAVRIRRVADALEATISIRADGPARTRVLRDRDCTVLSHAAAVVVALAIDDSARTSAAAGSKRVRTGNGRSTGVAPASGDAKSPAPAANGSASNDDGAASAGDSRDSSVAAGAVAASPSEGSGTAPTPAVDSAATDDAAAVQANVMRAKALAAADAAREAARAAREAAARDAETRDAASSEAENENAEPADDDPELVAPAADDAYADSPARVGFSLGLAGALGLGVLPSLAPGVAICASFLGPGWRLGLRLGYAPAQHAVLEDPPANAPADAGGKVALASVAVDGGFRWQLSSFEVPLVAGVEAGIFDSIGQNVPHHVRGSAAWLATYVGSGIGLQMTPALAAELRVEGLVPLLRPEFALEDAGKARVFHRPSPLGGRVALVVEARWQ